MIYDNKMYARNITKRVFFQFTHEIIKKITVCFLFSWDLKFQDL